MEVLARQRKATQLQQLAEAAAVVEQALAHRRHGAAAQPAAQQVQLVQGLPRAAQRDAQ